MATTKRRGDPSAFLRGLPEQIEKKLLRGAARAGIAVIKEEAEAKVASSVVREALTVKPPKVEAGRVTVKLTVDGQWPRSVANWLELGTSPHFISVDPEVSGGRTARRVNTLTKDGDEKLKNSLVINGKPVGKTVYHPGARPEPFLRPALDHKEREAIAAMQGYINAHVGPGGIIGGDAE